MRLEPKECRLQALTCERLAQRSTSPIVKGAYADLAKNWLKVADEIQVANNAAVMFMSSRIQHQMAPAEAQAYLLTSRQAAVCCQLSTFQSASDGEPGL